MTKDGQKTGGRSTGTPNRVTKELRQVLKAIVEQEAEKLPSLLDKLRPTDRVFAFIRLASFVIPTKAPETTERLQPVWNGQSFELVKLPDGNATELPLFADD
jgi:hypothetical protein